ncbi:MAG: type II toxin-antitoxin system RelE/ParE family toxin [Lachnospiraceae bacterium]|nr:type II toxin-antitoxin system RelE/ParE family toxin [Lachnospiraceae bacterium]
MKYKLKYSPDAGDKLREIKEKITSLYGKNVATKVMSTILGDIRGLMENPEKGPSVEALFGIPTPYRFLHVEHNYVFYRIENDTIYVTDIYNEREDFLWRMFRVNL